MHKISIFFFCFLLIGCANSTRLTSRSENLLVPTSSESNEIYSINVKKIRSQVIQVTIKPHSIEPGRIFSLSLIQGSENVEFPLPKPTDAEKDASILIPLEETEYGSLKIPFYKYATYKNQPEKNYNPFAIKPIRDISGKPVGAEATGILYFMSKGVGKGVIMTPNGDGEIILNDNDEYEFQVHFNTKISSWKILIGIVRVDIINPSLDFPILTKVFSVV